MFSRAVGREGCCRQTSLACVGSARSAPATLGLPRSRCLCFPRLHCSGSQLLYGERPCVACGSSFRVLHKSADSVAPAFCAFPGPSSSGSQVLVRGSPWVRRAFSPPRSQPQFPCPPVRCVCLLPSAAPACFHPHQSGACALCLAATLPADVNHPESKEVFG